MALQYSLELKPRGALLGEPLTATLKCVARGDSPAALTFDHRSLVLELDLDSNGEQSAEPFLRFPNRFSVDKDGKLVRVSLPGGVADLKDAEERTRSFDLMEQFPEAVLNVGTVSFTYRLEEADPPVRPAPVKAQLQSGPDSVLLLIDLLSSAPATVGLRAAQVLQKMTARDFTDAADWPRWWAEEGGRLPWNYLSDGATFGKEPGPPPPMRRGAHLGGIAYP